MKGFVKMRPVCLTLGLTAMVSIVTGCDQSDPMTSDDSDGGIDIDATAMHGPGCDAGDPEDLFFPLADGANLTYRHEGGSVPWDEEVSMTAVNHMGMPACQTLDSPGPSGSRTRTIFRKEGDVTRRVFKEVLKGSSIEAEVVYDPGFVRFDETWRSESAGFEQTLTYQRTERDGTGTIVRDAPREHKFTIEETGAGISVPVGSFEGCIKILRSRIRDSADPEVEGDEKEFWFCLGAGKVKEVDLVVNKTEELTRCSIPGATGVCAP